MPCLVLWLVAIPFSNQGSELLIWKQFGNLCIIEANILLDFCPTVDRLKSFSETSEKNCHTFCHFVTYRLGSYEIEEKIPCFALRLCQGPQTGLDPDLKIAVKMISYKFITSMFDIFKLLCDALYLVWSQGTVRAQSKHNSIQSV